MTDAPVKPSTIRDHKRKKKAVLRAIREGERSLEELCRIAGFEPLTFYVFRRNYHITLQDDILPFRYNPIYDDLIEKGYSLPEMKAEAGGTMEKARLYINASGQHAYWHKLREENKRNDKAKREILPNAQRSLVSVLKGITLKKAAEESLAHFHAVDYYLNKFSIQRIQMLDDLIVIFDRYFNALDSGTKLSLEELTEGTGLCSARLGRILEKQGLEPLYGSREPHRMTAKERRRLDLAYDVVMSDSDMSYFTRLNPWTVTKYFRTKGHKKPRRNRVSRLESTGKDICYRKASRAYQMADRGLAFDIIKRKLGGFPKSLQIMFDTRQELELQIIAALKTMYPEKEVTKPYVTWYVDRHRR